MISLSFSALMTKLRTMLNGNVVHTLYVVLLGLSIFHHWTCVAVIACWVLLFLLSGDIAQMDVNFVRILFIYWDNHIASILVWLLVMNTLIDLQVWENFMDCHGVWSFYYKFAEFLHLSKISDINIIHNFFFFFFWVADGVS